MPILTEVERLGTTLDGRYVLRSILGRGGMGVVYAAEHALTGRSVAVKLVRPELADDPRYAERLFREARAAASLQHPNVVDVLDMGTLEDGGLYLVLERLEGFDFATVLDAEGPLAVERVLRVIDPVLDALEALHAKGIVHRDLKPSNVFLTRRGPVEVPKLLDFGIAKLREARGATTTGRILGTPWYMSPEQAAGDVEAGPEVDVWAVGAMLFECLSGRVPFDGPTPTAVLMNVLRHDAPKLELPEAPHVAEAVRRAMSKGDDRIRSAAALREALQGRAAGGAEARTPEARGAVAPGSVVRAPDELAVTRNLARPDVASTRPLRRGGVVAIVVAVVAAVSAIGWAASREDEPPTVLEPDARVAEEAARDAPASADTRVEAATDVVPIADELRSEVARGSQTSARSAPSSASSSSASSSASPSASSAASSSSSSSSASSTPSSTPSRSAEDAPRRPGRTARRSGQAADESRAASPPTPANAPSSSEPSRTPDPSEGSGELRPTEPSLRTRW